MLDGVPKSRAWDGWTIRSKIALEAKSVGPARLPQEPASSLLNEVLGIRAERVGNTVREIEREPASRQAHQRHGRRASRGHAQLECGR